MSDARATGHKTFSSSIRLDVLLVEQGYFSSRAQAQAAIKEGYVQIEGRVVDKAAGKVKQDATITVTGHSHDFVSRGGLKLAHGLEVLASMYQGEWSWILGHRQVALPMLY